MRLYSFVNYYLSPLQHGLQTAHCVAEMSIKSAASVAVGGLAAINGDIYQQWAANHKTIIILNGGNSKQLHQLQQQLVGMIFRARQETGVLLPNFLFHEDLESLNCAATALSIILPESCYLTDPGASASHQAFAELLSNYRLA